MTYNYSENEYKLFEFFGFYREVVKNFKRHYLVRTIGLEVFYRGLQGPEVEVLRRYVRDYENNIVQSENDWNDIARME